jgi:hypothetical protein
VNQPGLPNKINEFFRNDSEGASLCAPTKKIGLGVDFWGEFWYFYIMGKYAVL